MRLCSECSQFDQGGRRVYESASECDRLLARRTGFSKGSEIGLQTPRFFFLSFQAIMGGVCVDTKENLGPPLTNLVAAYLSVAGERNFRRATLASKRAKFLGAQRGARACLWITYGTCKSVEC